MSEHSTSSNDPDDSHFLQNILTAHWIPILVGMLAGLVIAIFVAASQPKVWPAMSLGKIGQVGGSGPLTDTNALLSRTQFPSFIQDVLRVAGMPIDVAHDPRAKLAKKTLNTQIQKGPSLFQMQVDGYTKEDAQLILTSALTVLQREHQALLDVAVEEKKERLKQLEASIAGNQKERQAILSSIETAAEKSGAQLPDTVMVSYLLRANEIEHARFVEQQTTLKDQLQDAKTYNTRFEAPVFVSDTPESPSKLIAGGVGAILGFAFMVVIFALRAWLKPTRN